MRSRTRRARFREPASAYIFIAPVLVLFVVFMFLPLLGSGGISLTDYRLNGSFSFVGIKNYVKLLSDPVFLSSLVTTLIYAAMFVPAIIIVSMLAALLLHGVRFFQGFFRALLFLPYVTSFVFAGIIWKWVYSPDGLINGLLHDAGSPPIPFLQGGPLIVIASIALVSVWQGFGYSMLILLAGLKTVPEELMEAATLDGAGPVARFFRVTVPLLKPVIFFVLVIETIVAFQVFDVVYVMTGGGPARATYTLVYELYDQGFKFFNFGYAATIGLAIFVIVLVVSLIQRKLLDRESA